MKHIKILSVLFISSILFASCEEEIMEWEERPENERVTTADLPLELEEKISRYEPLKTYSDYVLGAGIILDLYMNNETYRSIVDENFDEVTVGYAMKHGAMVNSEGEINFGPIDDFIALTNQAEVDVYGHTLVWHANQNASYLNGLIAPTVIPGSSGASALDISGLQDGSFDGWARNNPGAGITIAEDEGLTDDSQAIQLTAGSGSAEPYDLQLATSEIPVVEWHEYEVSFYIRSDQPGQGRISFSGLENNYPYQDWYGTGGEYTEAFETTSQWQQVKFTVNDFADTSFNLSFDLGYVPDVTYYIDVNNISVVDLDADAETVNLITNSDFEGGNLDGWTGHGNESTRSVSAEGAGYGDTGYAMILTNPTEAQLYEAQQVFTLDEPLEEGTEYTISFYVKADVPATMQVQLQNVDYAADYSGGIEVGTNWQQVVRTMTPTTADRTKFVFDFGQTATTFYIDDVVLTSGEVATGTGPVIIEMSDEEKAEIIGAAMEDWVVSMVTRYTSEVTAWDVVNEPMREGGSLRDGNVTDLASDDFYWQKYLGKDYAVTAFNLAREHAEPSDVLFINDYNLEASMAKLDGLIEYVQYIESQGATVDGIGTQMHVTLNTSRDNIVEMFQKMAATGKIIKVSELDVRLGTASPTTAQLAEQADMYQFIVDSYNEYIPSSQQYGITIWNISDNPNEHEFWLPDESPNLWDADYERKHAYKGVADGLAGRDVSEDFTGELE
ncbi:endo-1,4-beta-xylanase [Salegentibacter sp. F188]|uniref:endo-1,4-beta-xylanase n=1 Tax=Autumnicola patrickiae TaxID=3075591 RepID=A0ABU3E320_9FLAO|nr:endo-1,4-beta-xylanase [Salegentibacter sp. F188]MDT0690378.1 endo-1,4-beta-xylanase [Salegentibacter sp. F188]